jgi:hypothetical protein
MTAKSLIVVATSVILLAAALPALSQQTITPQMLQTDLGIGNVTPPGATTLPAYQFWQFPACYLFGAAGFTTPYLTLESQMDNWNYVLYGRARVDRGSTRPVAPEIQNLTAAQRTAIENGNYAAVETPTFTPTLPIQVSETGKSADGKYFYYVLTINPLAVIPTYSGYSPTIGGYSFLIAAPGGTTIYNLSIPVNPNQTNWQDVALSVTGIWDGVAIDAGAGGLPVAEVAQSIYVVLQALQAGSSPANVIEFTSSGLTAPAAAALQNINYLVVYQSATDVENLELSISASEQWTYSLSTPPSQTIVNPTPPSGSYAVQTTITIP